MLIGALGMTIVIPLRPLLVWNASASAPIGLYGVTAPQDVVTGDMVIARVPKGWRSLASRRRYIPAKVPLVKRVAAAPGDTVCSVGPEIVIDGRLRAERRPMDGRGRLMPWWQGCTTLRDGAVFLLNADPASFDGRYFGPTDRSDIIGRAHPLWTR
jgi:conjugative transfer signal peptidase TraF